jgi:DNA-binding helix-hairpin-helix protein with protein kinase domain
MARELKQCNKNPSHIWMADISFCPYCNMSPDARVHGQKQSDEIEKLKPKKGVLK